MKVKREIEVKVCDHCQQEARFQCGGCGKDVCWDCSESRGEKYQDFVTGCSNTGYYCHGCVPQMAEDKLYLAYTRIASLIAEHKAHCENFDQHRIVAESEIRQLLAAKRRKTAAG